MKREFVMVFDSSPRLATICGLFGTSVVPVVDVDPSGATVDIERLRADVRANLAGIGEGGMTFVIALGDDCVIVESYGIGV